LLAKHGSGKSKFAQHVIENGHAFGPIEGIMDTVHFANKGRLMNAIEGFYIFRETKLNNELNDKLTAKPSVIFTL
jgi:hypothetical protein